MSDYFNGELQAWGMFQNRSGAVVKRFHVAMTGTWRGDVGVLDERFTYSDGSTERRVWTLKNRPMAVGVALPMMWWARLSVTLLATLLTGVTNCA